MIQRSSKHRTARKLHPTLIVHGDADAVVPHRNAASLHARIPGSRMHLHEGGGHFFWAHRPAEVAGLLAQFLIECDSER